MFNIKNIRELGLKQGFLTEGKKGIDNLLGIVKRFLKLLNVPFYDECCPETNTPLPVGYTEGDETLRYYDPVTKQFEEITVSGGGAGPITIENGNSLFSTGLNNTGDNSLAVNSNFFGQEAGQDATNADYSNFFGNQAGKDATNANSSNFLGTDAGFQATNARNSNFFGEEAGLQATFANGSNFIGFNAGSGATNASNSIFIGRGAGVSDTVDNTANGLSSILIGSYANTGGFNNSILLGSGLVGFPIANTKVNQFMLADTITDVRWSGVEYTLPSTQAANAGDVLSNNGAGVLSWVAGGGSVYKTSVEVIGTSENLVSGKIREVKRLIFRGVTGPTGVSNILLTGFSPELILSLTGTFNLDALNIVPLNYSTSTMSDGELNSTNIAVVYKPATNSIQVTAFQNFFGTTAINGAYTIIIEFQEN